MSSLFWASPNHACRCAGVDSRACGPADFGARGGLGPPPFDYHPGVRVVIPTREGVGGVDIADLLPLAAAWDFADGSEMA